MQGASPAPEPVRRPLRILFVDDDPADVELQRLALRHDFSVEGRRVESADALKEALTGDIDVILCDYQMPGFSGMQALEMWNKGGRRVPFIFITGRLSEELAVECLKAGATDYIIKGNLVRLPAAVARGLREFAAAREMQRLEAERARVATAVDQAFEAVVITGLDGTIVYVNPAFTRVTGYTPEEAIGQTPRLLRSGLQPPEFYGDLWRTITMGAVWHGELVNRRRDGSLYDAELTIAPVSDENGAITSFCAIQRDVTARVAAERHLRELNARLAETDRVKDEFLAAFSHELRTPLNIIIGYAGLLLETANRNLDEESHLFLERIHNSGVHLASLINETLDLARLRIGALQVKQIPVDIAVLVREIVGSMEPIAARKGLRLTAQIDVDSADCETDPLRLRQILTNLIDNAIKFTDEGSVKVRLTANEEQFAIEVRDTGIGIEASDIPIIFEDFRQLDGSASRSHGGCGLGLALARRLLDLLGGDISIESSPGRGSCFAVTVPRNTANAPRSERGS